ncbi:hypothetical protein [Bradyrhizobium sp. 197]|nr:hypothetical protein [Bradyrhizobium sp. 197]
MSSMETPPDPDEPEPTERQILTAKRLALFWVCAIIVVAVLLPR